MPANVSSCVEAICVRPLANPSVYELLENLWIDPVVERVIVLDNPVLRVVIFFPRSVPEDCHIVASPFLGVRVGVRGEAAVVPVLVNWIIGEVHVGCALRERLLLIQRQHLEESC